MSEMVKNQERKGVDLDTVRIEDYLEHGSRFRFVERVVNFLPDAAIECTYMFTGDEPYMQDHFPDRRIMAGVLLIEGMLQSAALLYMLSTGTRKQRVVVDNVQEITWHLPVQPPKQLTYHVVAVERLENRWVFAGKVFYARRLMAESKRFSGVVPR